jgi:putative endonuclease
MSQHNEVGKIGEDFAKKYLEEKGYKILEQNYRTKYAEIDLVCEKSRGFLGLGKPTLVFVEVRTKIGEQWGSPEDTINKTKLQKVLWNAKTYSAFKKWDGLARIDAVCIVMNNDFSVNRLTHHENIIEG